jgi:hypothetical protein
MQEPCQAQRRDLPKEDRTRLILNNIINFSDLKNEFYEILSSQGGLSALFFPAPQRRERSAKAERFVEKRGGARILLCISRD